LLACRFIRDDFVGFLIETLPAVLLLEGNDKDSLAYRGLAIPGDVESRDLAQAGLRGGAQAQVGDVPPLSAAGAARGLAEHHDVLGHGAGNVQEQTDTVIVIGDDKLADGVGAKVHGGGRQQEHLEAEAGAGAVDTLEMLLAGQRAGCAETLGALDFGAGHAPGVALGLGEQSAPRLREPAKGAAHVVARWGRGVLGNNVLAPALTITADVGDFIADLAAAGFRENLHKVLFTVLAAGGVAGLLPSLTAWPSMSQMGMKIN
jgi:hypothetical protein